MNGSAADPPSPELGAMPAVGFPPTESGSSPSGPGGAELQLRPDRLVVTLWRIEWAITLVIMAAAATGGGFGLWTETEFPKFLILGAFPVVLLALVVVAVWLPPKQWAAWSVRFDGHLLEIRSGVLTRISVLIPVSRLQHVDVTQGVIERRLHLASLVVHTAGTRNPSHTIPGLEVRSAEEMRDRLVETAHLDAGGQR